MTGEHESRKPFLTACSSCGHVWAAAWIPMEVSKFAKVTRGLACPMCAAGGRKILIATAAQAERFNATHPNGAPGDTP